MDDDDTKEWKLYDAGPRSVTCPILCLPPASGTADVFFKQVIALSALGYRVIAVSVNRFFSEHTTIINSYSL